MLRFTRSEARSILAVLRQSGLVNFSRRIQPPITLIQAGTQLRVLCANQNLWVLWEREFNSVLKVGDGYPLRLTVPAILLKDCAGPDHGLVELAPDQDQVCAHWHDAGLVYEREYPQFDAPEDNLFGHPREYFPCPPELLTALRETMAVREDCTSRYALGCIQLSGSRQRLAGTDCHQLLICQGVSLPWNEELLVQGTDIFESPEFRKGYVARIGKTESHLVVQVGHWKVGLKINTESRFPQVDLAVPNLSERASRLEIHPLDRSRLQELWARFPKDPQHHRTLTIDLTGNVPVLRMSPEANSRATEIQLSRSQGTGSPGRIAIKERFFATALRLGFRHLGFHSDSSPLRLDQDQRTYVIMALSPEAIIPAGDHPVISTDPEAAEDHRDRRAVTGFQPTPQRAEMATV